MSVPVEEEGQSPKPPKQCYPEGHSESTPLGHLVPHLPFASPQSVPHLLSAKVLKERIEYILKELRRIVIKIVVFKLNRITLEFNYKLKIYWV